MYSRFPAYMFFFHILYFSIQIYCIPENYDIQDQIKKYIVFYIYFFISRNINLTMGTLIYYCYKATYFQAMMDTERDLPRVADDTSRHTCFDNSNIQIENCQKNSVTYELKCM